MEPDAAAASRQHRHGLRALTRPSPAHASWTCSLGLWPSLPFGGTPLLEAGTSARRLAPSVLYHERGPVGIEPVTYMLALAGTVLPGCDVFWAGLCEK